MALTNKISLAAIATALISSPFWLPLLVDAEGTDDQATSLISEINTNYIPWAESVIELPSDNAESFMFAFQIMLGILLLLWGFRKLSQFDKATVTKA